MLCKRRLFSNRFLFTAITFFRFHLIIKGLHLCVIESQRRLGCGGNGFQENVHKQNLHKHKGIRQAGPAGRWKSFKHTSHDPQILFHLMMELENLKNNLI